MKNIEGVYTALITPKSKNGRVDVEALVDLVEYQIESGVDGILCLGGTGEYSALTLEERMRVLDTCVKTAKKRIHVMSGILEPGIGEAIKAGKAFKALGTDSLLLVTPFYILPSQKGIVDYYKIFDDEVDMPLLIYNIPYRTSVNLLPPAIEELTKHVENIIGIKECTPNFGQALELLALLEDKISILSGEEFLAVGEMFFGAKGAVLASANIVPDIWKRIVNLSLERKVDEAISLFQEYRPLFVLLFEECNPGPIHYAMKKMKLPCGHLSLPLQEPSEDLKRNIDRKLKELELI